MKSAAALVAELAGVSLRGRRLYEWRYLDTGELYSSGFAENACAFFLQSYAGEQPKKVVDVNPTGRSLGIFVAVTGERVVVNATAEKTKAWLHEVEGARRYDRNGREVSP